MATIRNFGVGTVRFNEGIIVSGSAGSDVHTVSVTGSMAIVNTIDDGTSNRTMLKLHNYRLDDAEIFDWAPTSIDFAIENVTGGAKVAEARIATVAVPVGGESHDTEIGERSSGLIFSTMLGAVGGGNLNEAMRINHLGHVGIGTNSPLTSLDVVYDYQGTTFENQLDDGQGGGKIIKYSPGANDTLTVGQLYFLHTDGTWDQADADIVDSAKGGSQLLGVGLGNARTVGVLLEGFVRIPSSEILNVPGAVDGLPVYVSTTAGHFDFTAPSGVGEFVRVVGYAIDDHSNDVLIYFNPSSTWIEL